MLAWRTLKRYEETGDIQNRPVQGRPRTARIPKLVKSTREKIRRNPKRSIKNLAKESTVLYGTMSTVLRKNLKMTPFSMSRKTNFSLKLLTNDSKDARFFFPSFKMARCQISFSVMKRNSTLNTTLTPKMIEFGLEMEMKHSVWWPGSNVRPQ